MDTVLAAFKKEYDASDADALRWKEELQNEIALHSDFALEKI